MNEGNYDDSLVIGLIFIIVIAIIFLSLLALFVFKDKIKDKFLGIDSQSSTIIHIDQHRRDLTNNANQVLNNSENGLTDLIVSSTLKRDEVSNVEIINDDGDTEIVKVCSNESGWQPTYQHKILSCSFGRVLFKNNKTDIWIFKCRSFF